MTEVIEINLNNKENKLNNLEDFDNDDFGKMSIKKENKDLENSEIYCYEKDNIFRNIFFIMTLFNLMNKFNLKKYNLDNILKNFSGFNSYIIIDFKLYCLYFLIYSN